MAPSGEANRPDAVPDSPRRIENNDLDETLPPCRECERHFFARGSSFNVFDATIVLISMVTFAADIVTDGLVASQYFVHGEAGWGCLTLGFVLVPCIIMQVFSARWYLADEDMTRWRWLFHCCLLGPVERYITVFETGLEARRSKDPLDFERLHHQQSDVCMLRLFESFLESAPQVVLQLYIMVATNDENLFTGIAGTVSLFSLCWAVVAYSRAHRLVRTDKNSVSWPGVVLQTIWRIGMISSRVVALVLFASAFKAYTFLVIGVHWLGMVLWVHLQQTDFCDTWLEERLFNCVISTIYIFCFFNLKEGSTRFRITLFYLVVAVENVALLLLWHHFETLDDWYTVLGFTVVFGGFVTGVTTMILYYRFFHPRGAILLCSGGNEKKNDVCQHGKSNRLSTFGHHGDFADIFPRSPTPTPQTSPSGFQTCPLAEEQCCGRLVPPDGKYSSSKPKLDFVDRVTAPPNRAKSLDCLVATENECEVDIPKRTSQSVHCLMSQPSELSTSSPQNSPASCTNSFQVYELSGFATDLVNRFDNQKRLALAHSMLADKSQMSTCSAQSGFGSFKTPCRACLTIRNDGVSLKELLKSRIRSYSQPNTPSSKAKITGSALCEIHGGLELGTCDTNPRHLALGQEASLPQSDKMTNLITPSSIKLSQMPSFIDSPETDGTLSAYEVQKIYDQILEREPVLRFSKRKLEFDEKDIHEGEVVGNHSGNIPGHAYISPAGTKQMLDVGWSVQGWDNQNSTEHSANPKTKLVPNLNSQKRNPHPTEIPKGGSDNYNNENDQKALNCNNENEQKALECKIRMHNAVIKTGPDFPDSVTRNAQSQAQPLQRGSSSQNVPKEPLYSKTTDLKFCQHPLQESTPSREKGRSPSLKFENSSHTDTLVPNLPNKSKSVQSPKVQKSHLQKKTITEVASNGSKMVVRKSGNVTPTCKPTSTPVAVKQLDSEEGVGVLENPLGTEKLNAPQKTLDQKGCHVIRKDGFPFKEIKLNTQTVPSNENSPSQPLSIANTPNRFNVKGFKTGLSSGKRENTCSAGVGVTPVTGKENKPLTPLSARMALLTTSPKSTPKNPPRKSLGKIPTNLVANKVALFNQ